MRKILLVSGDSFTDPHHHSHAYPNLHFPWKRWPELLAEKLDMDIIKIPHNNKSSETFKVDDVYCDESISIINEWYKEDFKKLDYLVW